MSIWGNWEMGLEILSSAARFGFPGWNDAEAEVEFDGGVWASKLRIREEWFGAVTRVSRNNSYCEVSVGLAGMGNKFEDDISRGIPFPILHDFHIRKFRFFV